MGPERRAAEEDALRDFVKHRGLSDLRAILNHDDGGRFISLAHSTGGAKQVSRFTAHSFVHSAEDQASRNRDRRANIAIGLAVLALIISAAAFYFDLAQP
ncbi:MAG: hypothetical protein CMF73_09975 [Maricaulis sp.]|nr:hypothetical protein [Maricaulis sp.]